MTSVEEALKRLLVEHKIVLKRFFPDANFKSHGRGCVCEICEAELALGVRKKEDCWTAKDEQVP